MGLHVIRSELQGPYAVLALASSKGLASRLMITL